MAKLMEIEGVGPAMAEKLGGAGITSTDDLLSKGATKAGRKTIADDSGIDEKRILKWVNMCDLFRIKGVGEEYADLLEASGVDTVPELAQRNAVNLVARMTEVNSEKKLVRALPNESTVEDWVKQASELPRKIEY